MPKPQRRLKAAQGRSRAVLGLGVVGRRSHKHRVLRRAGQRPHYSLLHRRPRRRNLRPPQRQLRHGQRQQPVRQLRLGGLVGLRGRRDGPVERLFCLFFGRLSGRLSDRRLSGRRLFVYRRRRRGVPGHRRRRGLAQGLFRGLCQGCCRGRGLRGFDGAPFLGHRLAQRHVVDEHPDGEKRRRLDGLALDDVAVEDGLGSVFRVCLV
mmetsp:Transcript_28867/g.97311  ORF Transcript_28867/g.97311 Transcript_28867/m.97311 type:complete len:207 (-) Transcript_28867:67-687(-)